MTTFEQVREWFYKRIEKDEEYFSYYGCTAEEAIEIARIRADSYLEEAIGLICAKALPQIDFSDRSETGFNFDFNQTERLLIPSLMYEFYIDRDIALLKLKEVNYTATEIRVFDPSNARTSFKALYDTVREYNAQLLDDYKNTDRKTGKFITLDFSLYDTQS